MRAKLIRAIFGLTTRAPRPSHPVPVCLHRASHMPSPLAQLVGTHAAPLCTRSLLPAKTPSYTIIAMRLHLAAVLGKRKKKVVDDCTGRHERRRKGFNKSCPPPPRKCKPGTTKPKHNRDGCGRKLKPKKKCNKKCS